MKTCTREKQKFSYILTARQSPKDMQQQARDKDPFVPGFGTNRVSVNAAGCHGTNGVSAVTAGYGRDLQRRKKKEKNNPGTAFHPDNLKQNDTAVKYDSAVKPHTTKYALYVQKFNHQTEYVSISPNCLHKALNCPHPHLSYWFI